MLKIISEIFEFSKDKFRKIPILKEFEWFEWFEWFGPSPIEPFNSGRAPRGGHRARRPRADFLRLCHEARRGLHEGRRRERSAEHRELGGAAGRGAGRFRRRRTARRCRGGDGDRPVQRLESGLPRGCSACPRSAARSRRHAPLSPSSVQGPRVEAEPLRSPRHEVGVLVERLNRSISNLTLIFHPKDQTL